MAWTARRHTFGPKAKLSQSSALSPQPPQPSAADDLDDTYLIGVLQELVEQSSGNIERVSSNAVPVINRVSAGYPRDFTDLS